MFKQFLITACSVAACMAMACGPSSSIIPTLDDTNSNTSLDSGTSDCGNPNSDSGTPNDSGLPRTLPDGGGSDSGEPASDCGLNTDSGTTSDSGSGKDSGTTSDSGGSKDSGTTGDSGSSKDSGSNPDSGTTSDSGGGTDGGTCTTYCTNTYNTCVHTCKNSNLCTSDEATCVAACQCAETTCDDSCNCDGQPPTCNGGPTPKPRCDSTDNDRFCGNDGTKTLVCHYPPGNPGNEHDICVGNAAVNTHLTHGDKMGDCVCP